MSQKKGYLEEIHRNSHFTWVVSLADANQSMFLTVIQVFNQSYADDVKGLETHTKHYFYWKKKKKSPEIRLGKKSKKRRYWEKIRKVLNAAMWQVDFWLLAGAFTFLPHESMYVTYNFCSFPVFFNFTPIFSPICTHCY